MATTIITKNSSTAGSVPTGAQLTTGELAINTADKRAFTKNGGGTVVELGTNPSTLGLPNGTANGVAYLNGSKVLTTGSALTFDGSKLTTSRGSGGTVARFENTFANQYGVLEIAGTSRGGEIDFLNGSTVLSSIYASTGSDIVFTTGAGFAEQMRLTSTGLGIGTSSPSYKLDVAGVIRGNSGIKSITASGTQAEFVLNQTGVASWSIYNPPSSTDIRFYNGSDLLTLTSSGNLGLGVTPSGKSKFEVYTSGAQANGVHVQYNSANRSVALAVTNSNAYPYLGYNTVQSTADNQNYVVNGYAATISADKVGAGGLQFNIAPSGTAGNAITFTQAMTLDASGNLVIGYTSATYKLDVWGTTSIVGQIRNNTVGTGALAQLQFSTSNNYDGFSKAAVGAICENANTRATALGFYSEGTDGTLGERARIDSSGNLLLGTATSSTGNNNGLILGSAAINIQHVSGTASGTSYENYWYNGSLIGSITQSGTAAVLYNVTSDQRLKENIQDAESASALIDSLQVRKYDWKSDGTHQRYGFVAQELVTVAPEAVHQPIDPEEMMAVDYSKLVPMLVKEIQSLRARVNVAEAKLAQL